MYTAILIILLPICVYIYIYIDNRTLRNVAYIISMRTPHKFADTQTNSPIFYPAMYLVTAELYHKTTQLFDLIVGE